MHTLLKYDAIIFELMMTLPGMATKSQDFRYALKEVSDTGHTKTKSL